MLTISLGPTSATALNLYDESPSIGYKIDRSTLRTGMGVLVDRVNGNHFNATFDVNYFPASWSALVNSWWQSQAELLLFVSSETTTQVFSCMIAGRTRPIGQRSLPHENLYNGKIILEGY